MLLIAVLQYQTSNYMHKRKVWDSVNFHFRNLQVLDITGCTGIDCAEAVCSYLLDFCPDLVVLGLDSLKETDKTSCLTKYEKETSRYLNWSHIMDQINGLENMSRLERRQSANLITDSTEKEQSCGQGWEPPRKFYVTYWSMLSVFFVDLNFCCWF